MYSSYVVNYKRVHYQILIEYIFVKNRQNCY